MFKVQIPEPPAESVILEFWAGLCTCILKAPDGSDAGGPQTTLRNH